MIAVAALTGAALGCRKSGSKQTVRPRTLRDVPAVRLAYQFTPDSEAPPSAAAADDAVTKLPSIQTDFETRRPNDALLRTVMSPDKQRVLALYATSEEQGGEFRIDLYDGNGLFLRTVTPTGLSGAFDSTVAWSPNGSYIAFIGRRAAAPKPTPTPLEEVAPVLSVPAVPDLSPPPAMATPTPTATPSVAVVPTFSTEQVYVCTRDGFDLTPLTTKDGLIYFHLAWAPDSHALASSACSEAEWNARRAELAAAGRPRLLELNGRERLLDDDSTDVKAVWSPDSSKVAIAFKTEVRIYDAVGDTPTQGSIPLGDELLAASRIYDSKVAQKNPAQANGNAATATPTPDRPPVSFNPIVRLEWPESDALFLQTGVELNYENAPVRTWMRWHKLKLSAQAALLG